MQYIYDFFDKFLINEHDERTAKYCIFSNFEDDRKVRTHKGNYVRLTFEHR